MSHCEIGVNEPTVVWSKVQYGSVHGMVINMEILG